MDLHVNFVTYASLDREVPILEVIWTRRPDLRDRTPESRYGHLILTGFAMAEVCTILSALVD